MAEITDDDILEEADRLARDLDLDEDQRNAITLGIQRLLWPPSPHAWMHEGEHIGLSIDRREGGWSGLLSCSHGCGRMWTVNLGPNPDAVHAALTAAHEEYRTGKATAVPAPGSGRQVSLSDLLGRSEYVEVQDQRLTRGGEH